MCWVFSKARDLALENTGVYRFTPGPKDYFEVTGLVIVAISNPILSCKQTLRY